MEASAPQGATSNAPAPMETGGAGDSQSWVDQVEVEYDFNRDRPVKHRRSQLRRWEDRPTHPFSLQDDKGRCTSAQQLYQYVGEQPPAHHNVATMGITHLYLEVVPCEARSLGNQVLCMIAEYHLTSTTQGSSSLSLLLLEAARTLLPPIEDYVSGRAFEGSRDVRVVERAKTLQIATWLHHLDMAVEGHEMASQALEAARHRKGPLLDLLLAPMTGSLTFKEVVGCVLDENRHRAERSLANLEECHAWIRRELDDLIEAHQEESEKFARKRIKEIDLRWKDIKSLRFAISHHESNLWLDQPVDAATNDDDSSGHGAEEATEVEMATTPVANNTPLGSARAPFPDPPSAEGQAPAMEVDDKDGGLCPLAPSCLGRMTY